MARYAAAALILGLTMTAIGGYIAAAVAGRRSLAHGLGVGILSTVGALALTWLQGGDDSPLWYQALAYGFTIPAAVLGSWVRRRFWGEGAERTRPRSGAYPNLTQAVGLLFLLIFVTGVVGVAAGFVAAPALRGRAPLPAWGVMALLAAAAAGDTLILLWAARRARAPAGEIFPLRAAGVAGFWPAVVTVSGAVILLSEATNLLLRAFSMPRVPVDPSGFFAGLEGGLWAAVIFVVVLGPVAEELLFRGVILRGFLSHYPARKAVLASALLFGIFHVNPFQIVTATVLGVVFGWWRVATGSLLLPLLGHGLYNALVLLAVCGEHFSKHHERGDLQRAGPRGMAGGKRGCPAGRNGQPRDA